MDDVDREAQWASIEIRESLVGRRAGGGAAKKARELRREAPISALVSRVRRVHTRERAWSRGATGEEGRRLLALSPARRVGTRCTTCRWESAAPTSITS